MLYLHTSSLETEPSWIGLSVRHDRSNPKLSLWYEVLYNEVMSPLHKQLVTDEQGRPVGVLIPYEEWLRIEQQLGITSGADGSAQLQCHEGVIHLAEDPVVYQRRLRDEWT